MPQEQLKEFTIRGLILGALITLIFTAANIYLGLKVGLTFASSIPAAVLSMALLRKFKGSNILENNLVQTQASAAGTLSSVIFVLPGLLMVGYWSGFPFWQTSLLCAAGGILGVLYTIPLRRVMVVQSTLPYPEGVAAAEVLKVGNAPVDPDTGRSAAAEGLRDIMGGGLVAAVFALVSGGFKWLGEGINGWFQIGPSVFRVATGFSPALVAAGFMMGIRGGMAILVGLLICWGVTVPLLTAQETLAIGQSIADLGTTQWRIQARFLGAGVIAIAAVWTVITLVAPIYHGMRRSFAQSKTADSAGKSESTTRTERDMPPVWMALLASGVFVLVLLLVHGFIVEGAPEMSGAAQWTLSAACVLFVFFFGFLIAAACGYMAGLVGSSASPISGIGIIGVIMVSVLILAMQQLAPGLFTGLTSKLALALVLFTVSTIVCVAAISNDNLQDLKTGYLVGATPWRQQMVLVIGCVVGALVIPPVLELLYHAYGFVGALPRADMNPEQALAAPQATLMTAVASGIFDGKLNWTMVLSGIALGAVLIGIDIALRASGKGSLPPLAVGMGIYLPPTIGMTLFIGAVLGWVVERALKRRAASQGYSAAWLEVAERRGVLLASGLIVGESLMGIVLAAVIGLSGKSEPLALVGHDFEHTAQWLGLAYLVGVCVWLYQRVLGTRKV